MMKKKEMEIKNENYKSKRKSKKGKHKGQTCCPCHPIPSFDKKSILGQCALAKGVGTFA